MLKPRSIGASVARKKIGCFVLLTLVVSARSLPLLASVTVELINPESKPGSNAWQDTAVFEYQVAALAFTRLPQAFTPDGLRDEWPNPLLVRAEANVELPSGKLQILLRSRRAARLYVNGELLAETPFPPKIQDGHDSVERPFIPLGPAVRFPGPGDQEQLVGFESSGNRHHFRLEFFVGGYAGKQVLRPETGETLVAFARDKDADFRLVSPDKEIALTDAAWDRFQKESHQSLDALDRNRRRALQTATNAYWERRHRFAQQVVDQQFPDNNALSVDLLIDQRIIATNRSINNSEQALQFHREIRPILKNHCLSCHGKKSKGGLRLDSLSAARAGGDSGEPAIVPKAADASLLIKLVTSHEEEERMPPKGSPLSTKEITALRDWIDSGALWPKTALTAPVKTTPVTSDAEFLRRVYLDTIGIPPSAESVRSFIADPRADKRMRVIDERLADPRWADHWTSYWQDVLAENPTIVNPTLNNTGPFRWWIHDSFRDNKAIDRFVTELIMMGGSLHNGGPRGFEMASQNDVPMAAKANILSTAFLAVQMKCSRCHDAPFHDNTQQNLFGLAAMLSRKPISLPASSSVPQDKLHTGTRKPLIKVTLKPGTLVKPAWAFPELNRPALNSSWLKEPENTREQLALHITSPHNQRFAEVIVNRLWQRFFGTGIVEPVDDWENAEVSHPKLLRFLALEFVRNEYDLKALARLVLNSNAYQRQTGLNSDAHHLLAAPRPRRMTAEQIVDSLFFATGKEMRTEALTVDIGGGRPWSNALNLGHPTRAWMFGGMANNRDRPSLILPRAQAVIDLLTQFGWRPSRQEPTSYRQSPLSPLQPAVINNSPVSVWLTRLSDDHPLTHLALESQSLSELVVELYLRILNRPPSAKEAQETKTLLLPGFQDRITPPAQVNQSRTQITPPRFVTWANHLHPEATGIQLEEARRAREGDPVTQRLEPDWRERLEDVIWALINLPETIHYP